MFDTSKGIELIKFYEGCKLDIYQDCVGKNTIGIGHLILPSEDFSNGITEQQAIDLLNKDMAPLYNYLDNLSLNDNQKCALLDFGFNLGLGALKTMLGHGLSNIPNQILKWCNAGGKPNPVLLKRRQAELNLFNS